MIGKRILIVGGGYIGMYTALGLRGLGQRGHRIIVVNPENFMQYQPFLPEVAAGTIDPRAVVVPLRRVLRHADLVIGEVELIDHPARTASVRLADGRVIELGYDIVVLGPGSRSRVLPVPGLAERGVGFKTVQEAIYLRNRVLSLLDVAAAADDPDRRRAALTFVFVGGGYAGVEALGELEDLARDAVENYSALSRSDMRWVLVEAAEAILPEIGENLWRYARERLEERGIEVMLGTRLESAEGGVMRLSNGEEFAADTLVWTAGVKPSPLPTQSGLPVDDGGRLRVDRYLRVEGLEDAWGAGDVAAVPETGGSFSPPTAQHALRQAKRIASNVTAVIEGGEPEPFAWQNLGMLASLGRYKGVANPLGVRLKGFPAWFLHRSYHLVYVPTISRKVRIAMDWTVALLFPRDIAQLGSLEDPREPFRRAAARD